MRFKRICLEAKELNFKHPVTGKNLMISIDLAADLEKFLEEHE